MLSKTKVKYIQSLGHKKQRDEDKLFLAEGPKLVTELIQQANKHVKEIFALQEWADQHSDNANQITIVSEEELARISQLQHPNQVLAIADKFTHVAPVKSEKLLALALDGIQDPGNFGTILRTADWFGLDQIYCSRTTAELYNPKVVQATMGSIVRVKVHYVDLEEWIKDRSDLECYAAVLNGENITNMPKIEKGIILIGNEGKGISQPLLNLVSRKVTIPGKGSAESLNAAIATAVILSHLIST